jgi:hypothetical protein
MYWRPETGDSAVAKDSKMLLNERICNSVTLNYTVYRFDCQMDYLVVYQAIV